MPTLRTGIAVQFHHRRRGAHSLTRSSQFQPVYKRDPDNPQARRSYSPPTDKNIVHRTPSPSLPDSTGNSRRAPLPVHDNATYSHANVFYRVQSGPNR